MWGPLFAKGGSPPCGWGPSPESKGPLGGKAAGWGPPPCGMGPLGGKGPLCSKGPLGGKDGCGWGAPLCGKDAWGPYGFNGGPCGKGCGSKMGKFPGAFAKGGPGAKGGVPTTPPMPVSRFSPQDECMPSELCPDWVESGSCQEGVNCLFAHGVHELDPEHVPSCGISRFLHTGFKPTKTCTFFEIGKCTRGISCTFAHDDSELS